MTREPDLLPLLLFAGIAFIVFGLFKPKEPAKTLTVTGIKYGGIPSPYPPEPSIWDVPY